MNREQAGQYLYSLDIDIDSVRDCDLFSLTEFFFQQGWWDEWVYLKSILFSFHYKSDFSSPEAKGSLEEMLAAAPLVPGMLSQVTIQRLKGSIAQQSSQHQAALHYYLDALKILNEMGESGQRYLKEKGFLFLNLSMLLLNGENINRSIYYAEQAIQIFMLLDIRRALISSYLVMAEIYKVLEQFQDSFHHLQLTFDYLIANKDWQRLCLSYLSSGDLLQKMDRPDEAREMLQKSIELGKIHQYSLFVKTAYQLLSNLAIARGEYSQAIEYLMLSGQYAQDTEITDSERLRRLRTFADLYRQMGDHLKANEQLEQFIELQEMVHQQNLQNNINELEIRYQIQQKERETELLRSAKEEVERTNQLLTDSNRELEDYAHIISHDLREPVRMVQNYLRLLERSLLSKASPEEFDFLQHALDGNQRISMLIADLLEFSRIGKEEEASVDVSLTEAVIVAQGFLQSYIEQRNARCVADPLPVIRGIKSQWVQLFMNLIENGMKYNQSEQPLVQILYEAQEAAHRIIIRDNGIGISPAYYEKIFVMFQRLHSRQEYTGTGIGLAICKKITERYGADIFIQPAPEQGSDFVLHIPYTLSRPVAVETN